MYPAISTHALREEGDSRLLPVMPRPSKFLPTPSARRATRQAAHVPPAYAISTHALREEGDLSHRSFRACPSIFLPTPSARRATLAPEYQALLTQEFLPTPSARRATKVVDYGRTLCLISTHALREEGDGWFGQVGVDGKISTHALREEGDTGQTVHSGACLISTHALREEGDSKCAGK